MKIATANYPITYHSSSVDWERHLENWVVQAVTQGAEILLFPEYASLEMVSLFSDPTASNLHLQMEVLQEWMPQFLEIYARLAKKHECIIIAPSIPLKDGAKYVNRVHVFGSGGLVGHQDKLFMTRFEEEEWEVSPGEAEVSLFKYKQICFGVQVCYDVEFAIGAHALSQAGANVILVPSCTETIKGAARVHIGAKARALEQQLITVVAQTTGDAPWSPAVDINYGYTAIYGPPDLGFPDDGVIAKGIPQLPGWLIHELDWMAVDTVRKNGSVLNKKCHETVSMAYKGRPVQVNEVIL